MTKKALITLWYADGLHGGVKYSAELGQYLHSKGYEVYLCGVVTNDATANFFCANNIKSYNVADFPTDIEFDLVWAHHWPILPYLIRKGLKYKRLINSSISHILLIERPLWFHKNVDLLLTLSSQTKLLYTTKYAIPASSIEVLPNTAPDIFFDYGFIPGSSLRRVAFVTNHPPHEIVAAAEILRHKGYDAIIYGATTQSVDVTPDLLAKYDVIVSIGKTVQYALAMGIPIYNYDHFGGCGYITPENLDTEEAYNFSGRNHFTKKTAEQIVDEIIAEYKTVSGMQNTLKGIANTRYRLSTRINNILLKVFGKKPVRHICINSKNKLLFDYCEMVVSNGASHNGTGRPVTVPNFAVIKPRKRGLARLFHHIRTGKI